MELGIIAILMHDGANEPKVEVRVFADSYHSDMRDLTYVSTTLLETITS